MGKFAHGFMGNLTIKPKKNMGAKKMNEIERFCIALEKAVPLGVESSCIRAFKPWLRRRLRALVRKAFWIKRDSAAFSVDEAFKDVFGFSIWKE